MRHTRAALAVLLAAQAGAAVPRAPAARPGAPRRIPAARAQLTAGAAAPMAAPAAEPFVRVVNAPAAALSPADLFSGAELARVEAAPAARASRRRRGGRGRGVSAVQSLRDAEARMSAPANAGGSGREFFDQAQGSPSGAFDAAPPDDHDGFPLLLMEAVLFPGVGRARLDGYTPAHPAVRQALEMDGYVIIGTPVEAGRHNGAAVLGRLRVEDGLVYLEALRPVKVRGHRTEEGRVPRVFFDYPPIVKSDPAKMKTLGQRAARVFSESRDRLGADPRLVKSVIETTRAPHELARLLAQELPLPNEVKLTLLLSESDQVLLESVIDAMEELAKDPPPPPSNKAVALARRVDGKETREDFQKKLDTLGMPPHARAAALEAFDQMKRAGGDEAEKLRIYVEWLTQLPWTARAEETLDVAALKAALEKGHHGQADANRGVLRFAAVRKRTGSTKGAILLFTGPPGVGKTTKADVIARALGRPLVRVSLGGVGDVSELRGHRRTYTDSTPGVIISKMREARVRNPVMLLDELDKVGAGRGGSADVAAALLEILDPAQNSTFRDHYLNLDYDLSDVLFIVTANDLSAIPGPLRDRLDVIEFSGYTPSEKLAIVREHLLPQELAATGLTAQDVSLTEPAVRRMIDAYTMEAGVRQLRRVLYSLLAEIVYQAELGAPAPGTVDVKVLEDYLGKAKHDGRLIAENGVGLGTGLAVSGLGGSVMNVVVTPMPGDSGKVTGREDQLSMIKDSARNAYVYVRSRAAKLGLTEKRLRTVGFDVSFTPSGKIDGPSAGTLMTTAMISALSGRPVKSGVAMTGEITPDGRVLPVGGVREKLIAAHRAGMRTVFIPEANASDLRDVPEEIKAELEIVPVSHYDQVFPRAFDAAKPAKP